MWAQPLYVQYQSADMSLFVAMTSSTTQTSTAQNTTTSSETSSVPSSTPSLGTSSNSLSGGAKAEIGIGVCLGVLALIGVVVFIIRHRRHRQQQRQPEHGTSMNKHELSNNGIPRPYEKDGSGVSHAPVEMSTEHERKAELAGNSPQEAEANARSDATRATKAS